MKKGFALALALVLALACFAPAMAEENDLLARIKQRGSVIVAMEGTWSPWTYVEEIDGEEVLLGFDVDVSRAIAKKLGVEASFELCQWDSIFGGLDAKRYDFVANGVDWTEERAAKYAFSIPYCYTHTVLIVRSDNEDIKSFEDLKGKRTANTLSSTYAQLTESYGATTDGVDDLDATIELVMLGRVDATANSEDAFYDYLRVHPDAPIKIVDRTETANLVCIEMRKDADSASLVEAVSKAIEELRAEGVLAELSIKNFGSDITAVPAE